MPFLIGMFDLLKSTFELRGASFIPGWIDDLASPDVLFSWNYPTILHRESVPPIADHPGSCHVPTAKAVDNIAKRSKSMDGTAETTTDNGYCDDGCVCCNVLPFPLRIEHLLALIHDPGHCTANVDPKKHEG